MVGGEGGGWGGRHDSTCQPCLDSGYKLGGRLRQRPCLGDCGGCWGQGPLSFHKCVGLGKVLWVGPFPLPCLPSPT